MCIEPRKRRNLLEHALRTVFYTLLNLHYLTTRVRGLSTAVQDIYTTIPKWTICKSLQELNWWYTWINHKTVTYALIYLCRLTWRWWEDSWISLKRCLPPLTLRSAFLLLKLVRVSFTLSLNTRAAWRHHLNHSCLVKLSRQRTVRLMTNMSNVRQRLAHSRSSGTRSFFVWSPCHLNRPPKLRDQQDIFCHIIRSLERIQRRSNPGLFLK